MLQLILEALGLGLFLAFVWGFGPAFFTLIQTSINRGFRSAAWFAVGVFLNDVLMVALCALASSSISVVTENELLFNLGAGLVLILFGIFTFIKKNKDNNYKKLNQQANEIIDSKGKVCKKKKKPMWLVYLGKGFALNILNPSVWIFWLSTVGGTATMLSGDMPRVFLFFGIVLTTSLCCDLLKAKGASWFKRFFNAKRLNIMNKVVGSFLMLFGVAFIVRGFLQYFGYIN